MGDGGLQSCKPVFPKLFAQLGHFFRLNRPLPLEMNGMRRPSVGHKGAMLPSLRMADVNTHLNLPFC